MHAYLLPFSYVWMFVAALLGLRLGIASLRFNAKIGEIAQSGDLASYHAASRAFNWSKTVHAHTFLFSTVAAVTFFALDRSVYGTTAKDVITAGIMAASVLWTLGAIKEIRPLMGIADFAFLFSVGAAAYGLVAAHLPGIS